MRHSDSYDPHTWRDPDAKFGKRPAWRGVAPSIGGAGWLALTLSAALLIGGAGMAWATREAPPQDRADQ